MSKKKMKLQELDEALIFVRSNLQNEKDKTSDNFKLYSRQLQKLEEIDAYVSTYEWVSKTQEVRDKIKFIRESGYDYDLCRRELNLSAEALKSLVKRANKSFVKYVGESTIDLIISRNNTIGLGMTQFGICSGKYKLSEILNSDFYNNLPEAKVDFFDIFECETEIGVMYMLSHFGIQEMLAKCSPKKLAFLRYILENPTERYAEEQRDLISVLLGVNIDFDTYMEHLAMLRSEKYGEDFDDNLDYIQSESEEGLEDEEDIGLKEDIFVPLSDDEFVPLSESDFVSLSEGDSEIDTMFVPLSEDFYRNSEEKSGENDLGFVPLGLDRDFSSEEITEEEGEDEILEDF